MHEASIAMSILGIARNAMKDQPNARVDRIDVAIGRLRAVEPELLVRSFSYLAKDTICAEATMHPREVPITAKCRSCNAISEIRHFRFECEACDCTDLEILSGRELRVEKITAVPVPSSGFEMVKGQMEREPVR